jgi:hypothetical protein
MPERLFEKVRRRTNATERFQERFLNEASATPPTAGIMSKSREERALWCYLNTDTIRVVEEEPNPQHARS